MTDNDFVKNWAGAKEAGLLRSAYHFADYRYVASLQAKYFYDLINDSPDLPPVLDFELREGVWNTPTPAACTKWIQNFFTTWKDITSMPIILYVNSGFIKYVLPNPIPDWLAEHDLWLAHYADEPNVRQWPAPWTFWQFTDRGDGLAAGVESKQIDMDYFYGTVGELMHYSVRTMGAPEPEPQPLTRDQQHDLMWIDYQERMK